MPIVFAVEDDIIYSAVDHKPKRTTALRRLANMAENPSVALLVDYYDDDWSRLWWARADGTGRLVATGSDEQRQAISALQSRYVEYVERPPAGPVVAVDVRRWSGWLGGSGTVSRLDDVAEGRRRSGRRPGGASAAAGQHLIDGNKGLFRGVLPISARFLTETG